MQEKNVSRRKFLKGGAVLGAAVGLSALSGSKVTEEAAKAFGKKELDSFPHAIADDYELYDEGRTVFMRERRGQLDKEAGLPGLYKVIDPTKPGGTQLDHSLALAAWRTQFAFGSQVYTWKNRRVNEHKYEFDSKEDATKTIKKAAKFYGADLVGITPYDRKWVYEPALAFNAKDETYIDECPFEPKSVIVMAIEMDYKAFSLAPSLIGDAAAGVIYSKMVEVSDKLTDFINRLGYNAFPSGNDTAESVPYAIAAGLGEQGRQGLLITYEYGPRVRICKVFTEIELIYDKPIKFGANDFCKVCKKCATYCPTQSISTADEMTWTAEEYSISNHEGVFKYYVNVETCHIYWATNGNGCGVCVAVCPYNKPDFWHHKITTALTSTPLKPFLNEMDDLFGYGDIYNDQEMIDYWDIENYIR